MLFQVKRHITWFSRPLIPQLPVRWVRISGCSAVLKGRTPDLGTDERCQHERDGSGWGTRYWGGGKMLPRSCSGGSPCSANAPGFGISYGYIHSRLLRIEWHLAEAEAAWLSHWPTISIYRGQGSPLPTNLLPGVSPHIAQGTSAHRSHAAAHRFMGFKSSVRIQP